MPDYEAPNFGRRQVLVRRRAISYDRDVGDLNILYNKALMCPRVCVYVCVCPFVHIEYTY